MHLQLLGDELGVPVRGLARRSAALGRPLEGWRVASKRLGALPRIQRGALGRGCGMEGSGALPLPRAAVIVSTRLRIQARVREVGRVARDGVHRDRLVGEREGLHALLPVRRRPHHARRRDHQRATCLDGGLSDEDPHGTGVGGCLALLEHDVVLCAAVGACQCRRQMAWAFGEFAPAWIAGVGR